MDVLQVLDEHRLIRNVILYACLIDPWIMVNLNIRSLLRGGIVIEVNAVRGCLYTVDEVHPGVFEAHIQLAYFSCGMGIVNNGVSLW